MFTINDEIQIVSLEKHIMRVNDDDSYDEHVYILTITNNDKEYYTIIDNAGFQSQLFKFKMLEKLIYNCKNCEKIGDVQCSMDLQRFTIIDTTITELTITLNFELRVKSLKTIEEDFTFRLTEKQCEKSSLENEICKLRYDLSQIKFVTRSDIAKIKFIKKSNFE